MLSYSSYIQLFKIPNNHPYLASTIAGSTHDRRPSNCNGGAFYEHWSPDFLCGKTPGVLFESSSGLPMVLEVAVLGWVLDWVEGAGGGTVVAGGEVVLVVLVTVRVVREPE